MQLNGTDIRNHKTIVPIIVVAGTAPDEFAPTRKKLIVNSMENIKLIINKRKSISNINSTDSYILHSCLYLHWE